MHLKRRSLTPLTITVSKYRHSPGTKRELIPNLQKHRIIPKCNAVLAECEFLKGNCGLPFDEF